MKLTKEQVEEQGLIFVKMSTLSEEQPIIWSHTYKFPRPNHWEDYRRDRFVILYLESNYARFYTAPIDEFDAPNTHFSGKCRSYEEFKLIKEMIGYD